MMHSNTSSLVLPTMSHLPDALMINLAKCRHSKDICDKEKMFNSNFICLDYDLKLVRYAS